MSCLKIHFNIVTCSLKMHSSAISVKIKNLAIDSVNLSESEELDTLSINTHSPKHQHSTTVKENLTDTCSVFHSENSFISMISIPQQHKDNSTDNVSIFNSKNFFIFSSLTSWQFLSVLLLINMFWEFQNDLISIHLFLINEDTNISSDTVDDEDSDYFIITCDNIATEDDLKENEVSFSHAIHIAIKRCE